MRDSRFPVIVLLVLTFAAGAAAGVTADRLWLNPATGVGAAPEGQAEESRADHGEGHGGEKGAKKKEKTVIERFSEELGLSAGQEAQIDTILEHYRERMKELRREVQPRYRSVVDSARARIEDVLSEEQAQRYRDLLERHRDGDDRDEKHGKKGGDRGGGKEAGSGKGASARHDHDHDHHGKRVDQRVIPRVGKLRDAPLR